MTTPTPDAGRTYSDERIEQVLNEWNELDYNDPADFANAAGDIGDNMHAMLWNLWKENRQLRAERDARAIQQTMYCSVSSCSAIAEFMFRGQWWCKQHAPLGSAEYADVPALRAQLAIAVEELANRGPDLDAMERDLAIAVEELATAKALSPWYDDDGRGDAEPPGLGTDSAMADTFGRESEGE